MKCPIDQISLSHLPVERKFLANLHLDVCRKCQGIWVDAGELERLVSHFSSDYQRTYQTWLIANTDGTTAPKDFWQETDRFCPRDGTTLERHYTGVAHKVGINQCPTCRGFWFDGSELYAVAKANEPNSALDNAIRGAVKGLHKEIGNNYHSDDVIAWDLFSKPATAIPHIGNLLLNLMLAYISRK